MTPDVQARPISDGRVRVRVEHAGRALEGTVRATTVDAPQVQRLAAVLVRELERA